MKNDLTIEFAGGKLNVRVAVWIEKDNQLLVSTFPDGTISLPGGRIAFGENSLTAIKREMLEETGASLLNPELFSIIENFFEIEVPYHEYLFIYKGNTGEQKIYDNPDDEEQVISWIPIEEVRKLYPRCLQSLVGKQKEDKVIHLINQEKV